jgi:hypothetical protein
MFTQALYQGYTKTDEDDTISKHRRKFKRCLLCARWEAIGPLIFF